jgi:hypothetical protein
LARERRLFNDLQVCTYVVPLFHAYKGT